MRLLGKNPLGIFEKIYKYIKQKLNIRCSSKCLELKSLMLIRPDGRDKYFNCFRKMHMCQEMRDKAFKKFGGHLNSKVLRVSVIFGISGYSFKSIPLKL